MLLSHHPLPHRVCARHGTSFDFNTPITESTTFTADWLDPATIGCPQLKIGFASRKLLV